MERARKELIKEYQRRRGMEAAAELVVAEAPVGVVVEAVAVVEDKK
jgi:hypothetical protein